MVVFLICTSMVNRCYAVDPNCGECEDCDPCKTPKYIQVTFKDIISSNGYCENTGGCNIGSWPAESINGSYILEFIAPDENHPWCRWCYDNNDPNIGSARTLDGSYDFATGLRICVIKNYYSKNNTMLIIADTISGSIFGYALYFGIGEAPIISGCVGNNNVSNQIQSCYCSSWYDIPPWSAGLGGTATIEELVVNFVDLARFANDWLKTGPDLDADLDGDGDVDLEDLSRFVDEWLSCCPYDWPLR